ncbi:hypothetical protein U3653_22200 [Nocardia sp. CDC186]|uniref:Uncharacterized protein n=1 Tax=Nocardia implantans TaxID=3108168 RepID=A0ABU6AZ70_9NOCA|nr:MULTISPECIES: hypothetical protein [unclassified Nocardia]MBF6194163.1 hypothetical protein [Nocardia beijingensis]MEA3529771.1 hypothetical protein [Nocardia sp. CDC192]MEB3512751.1 hypothetical protein [Nocardia sp. CDC186]
MSFFNTTVSGYDGIAVEYKAERESTYGRNPAWVHVALSGSDAYLCLSIVDARTLAQALPGILAEHDAAVSASVDKAA